MIQCAAPTRLCKVISLPLQANEQSIPEGGIDYAAYLCLSSAKYTGKLGFAKDKVAKADR